MRVLLVVFGMLIISALAGARPSYPPIEISAVTIIDGTRTLPLKDIAPSSRSRFGVPLSKQYFIFNGKNAAVRTANRTPVFEFIAGAGTNVSSNVYLFRFDVRADRREIRVAKGSGGLAELRIPKDHLVPVSVKDVGDGPNSTRRYRLTADMPLRPGEYCLAQGITAFYDFGVD